MVYWETDRFNDLNRGEYDVLFGTDFTASRDIFEVRCRCFALLGPIELINWLTTSLLLFD